MAEVGKPGINHLQVGPDARRKLAPLLAHYAKSPTPFRSCVRDNRKRFGPRTEGICAVVKDLIRGTTMWRGKGKELSASDLRRVVELADASGADCDELRRLRALAVKAALAAVTVYGLHPDDPRTLDAMTRAVELAGRTGKTQKQIKVRNAKGTTFTRTIWANPEQIARAKADRAKRAKGQDGPLVKKPGDTANHAAAGLRRLAGNVYVDGRGKTFKRAGEGKSSTFAPLSTKEAAVVKKVVRRAVAKRGGRIAKAP